MDHLTETKIDSKEIFKGRVIDLSLDRVRLPSGEEATREFVHHPGAVAVLAINDLGKLLLVRQYRYPLDRIIYEIPAGKLEPGESPDAAAARELEEETGYRTDDLERIASFYTTPGFSDEFIHLYVTHSLNAGKQQLDEDEFLECLAVTLSEALKMTAEGQIADAKTLLAVQYLQLHTQK